MRSALEDSVVPRRRRRRACSPVTRRVGGVGDVELAARQVHATHVSTVPKQRSRAAVGVGHVEQEGELGGRHVGREADALGLQHEAHADGAQVLPADAGPDRLARGAVPHDRRRPLVGDADGVDRAAGGRAPSRATSRAASAIAAASNSTKPGAGDDGSTSRWCTWSTVASASTTAARTPLVPTSTTRMRHVRPGRRRRGTAGRAGTASTAPSMPSARSRASSGERRSPTGLTSSVTADDAEHASTTRITAKPATAADRAVQERRRGRRRGRDAAADANADEDRRNATKHERLAESSSSTGEHARRRSGGRTSQHERAARRRGHDARRRRASGVRATDRAEGRRAGRACPG